MSLQNLPDRIIALTFDISRSMRQTMLRSMEGINPLQIFALSLIQEESGLTMKQFASGMKFSSPAATTLVRRLVKLGWVERMSDKNNRKLVRVRLTPAGRKILTVKMRERNAVLRKTIAKMPQQDQQDLVRILLNVQAALPSTEDGD